MDCARILIVDDDHALGDMLTELLERDGFSAEHVPTASAALGLLRRKTFEMFIVDIMMPRIDGLQFLQRVRMEHSTPVLMLTARGGDDDRILGLELGADDYLPKPFNARELVARIRSILRRTDRGRPVQPSTINVGPLSIDTDSMSAALRDVPVRLTTAEFKVLETLMRSAGEVQSRAGLSYRALGRPLELFDRSIDTHISNLRRKLSRGGARDVDIRSVRGQGYVLRTTSLN
jgi:two-component system response regulator CpxR